jgi:hypothetical protein
MAVDDTRARTVLIALGIALVVAAWVVDLPEGCEGRFWSDGATYYSMAWSLAVDADLEYEAHDVAHVREEFPQGPQGIFLKRSHGGWIWDSDAGFPWLRRLRQDEKRIYYAKSFAYPVFAAPFVWLFGTSGLLVANALCMGAALWFGYGLQRRRSSPLLSLLFSVAVFLTTVTPLYLIWPQPEIFNVGLIAAGLAAWATKRPVLSAVLFGLATYSKPTNVFLALPLGVEPLLPRPNEAWLKGLGESLRRGAVLGGVVVLSYGANYVVTGEINYQGGERKTFVNQRVFPEETASVTFGNSGEWMTTNQVGPLVEGQDEDKVARGSGPPLAAEELRGAFSANLGYFWVGRYAGVFAYFAPVLIAVLLFLWLGPRDSVGWLGLASLAVSYLFYIWLIPANWYGGGGTVGNRYFLNLVPLALLILPRGREWIALVVGGVVSAVFVLPILAAPFHHSLHPGVHAARAPYRLLPPELTMLNDLSFCIEGWRCKRSVGDTQGDAYRNWPADPKAYWLYFPDDGTVRGHEQVDGLEGFRVRRGLATEVIVRALEPVRGMTVVVHGGLAGDVIVATLGGRSETLLVGPGQRREFAFETGPGLLYYDTFVQSVQFRSRGASLSDEAKPEGAFVHLRLDVDRRPRR